MLGPYVGRLYLTFLLVLILLSAEVVRIDRGMKTLFRAIWRSASGSALGSDSRVKVAISAVKTFIDRGMSPEMIGLVKDSKGTERIAEGKTLAWILLKRADQSVAVRLFEGGAVG